MDREEHEAIFTYLIKDPGFAQVEEEEDRHYVRRTLPRRGVIDYGWEFQLFGIDGWCDPTEPGFYLWSGLGNRDSYGLFIPCNSIAEARQFICGLSFL